MDQNVDSQMKQDSVKVGSEGSWTANMDALFMAVDKPLLC